MWKGAAGKPDRRRRGHQHRTDPVCKLATMDRPQLVDGRARLLIDGTAPAHARPWTIAPGCVLKTPSVASNYCGPDPLPPTSVAFVVREWPAVPGHAGLADRRHGPAVQRHPGRPGSHRHAAVGALMRGDESGQLGRTPVRFVL